MSTDYNARIDLDRRPSNDRDDPWTDAVLDALAGFSPVVSGAGRGTELILTLPAEDLRTAITTALALATDAVGDARIVGLEVVTTAEFDRRLGLAPVPQLVSVTEAAQLLGVSRQAVLQRLDAGTLPGEKVGNAWVVQRAAVDRLTAADRSAPA